MIDVTLPRDADLEESMLNSLLTSVEAPPICIPLLTEDSFYYPFNKDVFRVIREDYDKHSSVDMFRVEGRLKEMNPDILLSHIYDSEWLNPANAESYCKSLNGLRAKRNWLRGVGNEAKNIGSRTPEELFTNTEKIIHDNLDSVTIPGLTPTQIEERDKNRTKGEQLFTGDTFMDKEFFKDSGSRRGQITVPFSDTGHGKTYWTIWLACRYLEQGYKGVYCIFESTDTKIKDRIKENLRDHSKLDNIIIVSVGQGMRNLDDSVNAIKYYNAIMDIDFFAADHLRIIPVPGVPDWKDTEKISTSINRYMILSQEVDAHGLCLSQVNRDTLRGVKGWSKDPDLQNLYGSSAIEQAAEMAISIFRPKRVEELHDYWPSGELRAVKGPDGDTYDSNSVFIRQKKTREGEQYIPYVRFVHGKNGLERKQNLKDDTPF